MTDVGRNSCLTFRPLRRQDFPLLSVWLAQPHVQSWWREEHDIAAIEARYGPSVDGVDPTECFVVDRNGEPVGFIQRYLFADNPEWQRALSVTGTPSNAAGIDYLIGSEQLIGQSLGPAVIQQFVDELWTRYPDVPAIVVDVSQGNRRSCRALEKAGFHRTWSGMLESDDPSDAGPAHVYVRHRPDP